MGIISFESFALFVFIVALGAYLVWKQAQAAGRKLSPPPEKKPDALNAMQDGIARELEDQSVEDFFNMKAEARKADIERKRIDNIAFRALGITPHAIYQLDGVWCSGPINFRGTKPFCGEGEKP